MTIRRNNPRATVSKEQSDAHFTVQQMLVLIMIVWLSTAAILPVVLPDSSGVVTERPTTSDWAPTVAVDERTELAG